MVDLLDVGMCMCIKLIWVLEHLLVGAVAVYLLTMSSACRFENFKGEGLGMFVVAPTLTLLIQLPSLIVSEPLVFKELLDLLRVFGGLK